MDAARFLPHVPKDRFPAEALSVALYLHAGLRAAGLGGLAFAEPDPATGALRLGPWEYLRLAIPRRVYSDNHLSYVASAVGDLWSKQEGIGGLRLVHASPDLPHFTAAFEPDD